jgi:broad specificity phosphatase PhoE
MRIFLVRHGQSMGNVDKTVHETTADHAIPLSPEGHRQAKEAGLVLSRYIDGLYPLPSPAKMWKEQKQPHIRLWTSPYLRTRQTSDGVQEGLGEWCTDRREEIALVEQHFGLFDGVPDDQLPILFPREHAHYKKCEDFEGRFWARMPMGESRFDVALRVKPFFGTLIRDKEKHGIENVVVVSHGVTLRAFAMQWLHLPFEWFEKEPNPWNCSIRLIENNVDKGYIFQGF